MATLIPQHDDEGRSATILPGVPLPDWALPAGPIAPEPEAEAEPVPEVPDLVDDEPRLVSVGAPAPERTVSDDTVAMAPVSALPAPPSSPYGAPLPIGANGPGPMRAGWDFPGSDMREMAHDEALAQAADDAAVAAAIAATDDLGTEPVESAAPVETGPPPAPVLADLPAPLAPPLPLAAADPSDLATDPVTDLPAPDSVALDLEAPSDAHEVDAEPADVEAEQADGDEEAPTSRRTLVALGALGGVLVLGAVAAFVWPGLLVSQDPEPAPASAAPVTAPVAPPAAVDLVTPASVGPYTKLTGAPDAALTRAVSSSTLPGLGSAVSAVYGSGTTPAITVIAWKSATPVGADAIPAAFAGFQGATSAVVTGITTTPVTPSGEMRCGTTVVGAEPASLCFWADGATFGSVTVLKPTTPEAAADTATAVRTAVVGG